MKTSYKPVHIKLVLRALLIKELTTDKWATPENIEQKFFILCDQPHQRIVCLSQNLRYGWLHFEVEQPGPLQ